MPVAQRMTANEYFDLPCEERRMQLIEGELVVSQPTPRHQRVLLRLLLHISDWVRAEAGRGEVILPLDVEIDEFNVFGPDLLWYAAGRSPGGEDDRSSSVPDLAVEVRSPSTWRYDIGAKKAGYERAGLPELWLVDTAADEVLVFRRSGPAAPAFDVSLELTSEDVLTSPRLPDFGLPLRSLF